MYIVVSKWQIRPGAETEWREKADAVRDVLRETPGVSMLHAFQTHDGAIAIVGYEDEAAYHRIVDDPSGPFMQAIEKHRLEDYSHWVWSERGEEAEG